LKLTQIPTSGSFVDAEHREKIEALIFSAEELSKAERFPEANNARPTV
jgi:hypothetical protein